MAKRQITKEQFIERKGSWTTYYNEAGTVCKVRNKDIEVLGEEQSARSPKPQLTAKTVTAAIKALDAGKSKVDDEGEEEDAGVKLRRVGNTKHDCSGYVKAKSATGNKTLDSGDALAVELRGLELDDVYARAAKDLGVTETSLRAQYKALNPGMQRMNLGNRIRGAQRKRAIVNDPKNA